MANQALINAAQKMYSAKAEQAQKNINPIVSGVAMATGDVVKALDQKQKDQQEKASKQTEGFKEIILKSGTARPELTTKLEELQEEYYQNLKTSGGLFRSKEKRSEATERNNQISTTLKAWEQDLIARDLNAKQPSSVSDFNGIAERGEDLSYKDDTLADSLIYKEDGIYTTNFKGEEVRLSDYKPPTQKFTEGFGKMIDARKDAISAGSTGLTWDFTKDRLAVQVDALMENDNYGSLLFDDVGSFNWATEQLKQEFPDADLSDPNVAAEKREELKMMVKANPDKYKQEFKDDVLRAYESDYNYAAKKSTTTSTSPSGTSTPLSASRLTDIEIFINSVNRGEDVQFPDGSYGKIVGGRVQLYKKSGSMLENVPPISLEEAMDRAKIPQEFREKVNPISDRRKTSTRGGTYDPKSGTVKNDPFNPNN
jgi:hypothetical protein